MASGMRIGEILLLREALDPWVLTQTIQAQPASRVRLVSLLVSRALIDPDDGALALSEQSDYPGAMQRHLEMRDPGVIDTIPAEVGRRWVVLPIARSRRGSLIIVARDPTPILAASLQHITRSPVELAVTPTIQLERLVRSVYGEPEPDPGHAAPLAAVSRSIIDFSVLEMSLDGEGAPSKRARTVSKMMAEHAPALPVSRGVSITKELDGTIDQINSAVNRAAAEQHAMAFASRRWQATLLASISDNTALGRRGHGAKLTAVEGVMLSTTSPSLIKVAIASRAATATVTKGPTQDRLLSLLGDPSAPSAAPIIVGGNVEGVIVVGDPAVELRNPLSKLAALADALGGAYERLPR